MLDLAISWFMVTVDVSVKALALTAIALLGIRFLRLRDSNVQHRAWTGVLIGMLLLPILSQTLPTLRLPVVLPEYWAMSSRSDLSSVFDTGGGEQTADATPQASTFRDANNLSGAALDPSLRPSDARSNSPSWRPGAEFADNHSDVATEDAIHRVVAGIQGNQRETVSNGGAPVSEARERSIWPVSLFVLWQIVAGMMAVRLLAGFIYSQRLVHSSSPITPEKLAEMGARSQWLHTGAPTPTICECPLIRVPMALGVVRPRILLPAQWHQWSTEKLQAVMAHEQAHIQRADGAILFLAEVNRCLYWFHPIAWWLRSQLSQLAETACDDAAIDCTGNRATYARHLLEVASVVSGQRGRLIAVGTSMARSPNVESRINSILDEDRPLSKRLTWTTTLLLLGALIPLVAVAASVGPATQTSSQSNDEQAANSEQLTASEDNQRRLAEKHPVGAEPLSFSGNVATPTGEPIAGAKIWLAVASHRHALEANRDNRQGLLRELGSTDERGRFEVVVDTRIIQDIRARQKTRSRQSIAQAQLVATANGRGMASMPLDVFADHPRPGASQDLLQANVDRSLGDGAFARRTLQLNPESQAVRGRLVDLEGRPLRNVKVSVERLRQPDVTRLLKAFESLSKREANEALSAAGFLAGIARSELQRLLPSVTTDDRGDFELRGIGDDQLVKLTFDAVRVDARPIYVFGREMETVSLPHIARNPDGPQDVFLGRDFTYELGPAVPVEGVVTDFDTGEPIADALVYVERLFQKVTSEASQLRLDTYHIRGMTDGQGRFRINGIPPGEGHVLEAVGPKSEPYLSTTQIISPSLEDGGVMRSDFQLKRGIWIEGRVTDARSNQPVVADVAYMALKNNPHSLERLGLDLASDVTPLTTDRDGHFRVVGLPGHGVLMVKSHVPSYPLGSGAAMIDGYDESTGVIPTTPYPLDVRFWGWHLLKQIAPAADATSLTCDLALDSGAAIPGRAVGPGGQAVTEVFVLGQTEGDPWWRPRHDDNVPATDRFEVNGYDGKGPRQLFFKTKDEALVGRYRLKGDAPSTITTRLESSVRVTGRVIDRVSGLPAARCFVSCERCAPTDATYPPVDFTIHWCRTDDEGHFEIKGLSARFVYEMIARSDNLTPQTNRFRIDLADAQPGEVIEMGDVTGNPNEKQVGTVSYSGRVETPEGQSVAGAKIFLAKTSYGGLSPAILREVGTSDDQGRFRVRFDSEATQAIRDRTSLWQTTLVAKAAGRGLDWLPLDVFVDNPEPSEQRDRLQARMDRSLGAGRFASRTLKLRRAEQPIRGRLFSSEGLPLPNVTVMVEDLQQPDMPLLLKSFEDQSKDGFYAAINATGVGVGDLGRDEFQTLIPSVQTDSNGVFELFGVGDDQLVSIAFASEYLQSQIVHALGRSMPSVRMPHISRYPDGAKDVFFGRDFTHIVGRSVPVDGVIKDDDTGDPVPNVLVYVERLFREHGGADEGQLRLNTDHMRAVSDADGRFRITGMPPGIGHVFEAMPPKSEPYLMSAQDITLRLDDGPAKEIEIRVKKGIWIEGQVTDKQTGDPIRATVDHLALRKNPHRLDKLGLRQAWVPQRYWTNETGHYRVPALPGPGVLLVTSQTPKGYPNAVGAESIDGYRSSTGYIPTTPIGLPVSNWDLLKQIDPAADATSFTCDLALDAGVSIAGRVIQGDGQSISGFSVLGATANDPFWKPHTSNTFSIHGYDGDGPRQLFFKSKDEALVGNYRLEGEPPENVIVQLQPSVRVTGRLIENETELPAVDYELYCERSSLFSKKYARTMFRIDKCRTNPEGRFEIRGLAAGLIYQMSASNPQHFVNDLNRFRIDLSDAKPGDIIDLGDVTGPNRASVGDNMR
ncbi:MAG: M56 family metallopeptidase [Planctomycetota bacterium]